MRNQIIGIFEQYKNHAICVIKKNKELLKYINENTFFLDKKCSLQERCFCILNDLKNVPLCPLCGKKCIFKTYSKGYTNTCSVKCGHKFSVRKRRKTCIEKYGVDSVTKTDFVKNKKKQTFIKKYGVDNPTKDWRIKNKIRKTCIEKYGYSTNLIIPETIKHTSKCIEGRRKEINEKIKNTCLQRYGVSYLQQADEFKNKSKQTCLDKYGVDNIFKTDQFKQKNKERMSNNFYNSIIETFECEPLFNVEEYVNVHQQYKWRCRKCNYVFVSDIYNGTRPICPICYPKQKSIPENEIVEYINSIYSGIVIQNKRNIIPSYELDVYLPDLKLAIEFNGNYWHSENGGGKCKKYHLLKTEKCQKKGIRLIQIFEDEWHFKKNIVKNRLKYILNNVKYKIYARKCFIQIISKKEKKNFLDKYHIQGNDKSSIYVGAFYKNRLVSVMTFGKTRIALGNNTSSGDEYELMRFASISNFRVIGIGSKLLKFFERKYTPKKIITYADRRWSNGGLYYKLGFCLDHISAPNYWYMKNYVKRLHRYNFAKHRLNEIMGETFDSKLSEWENMKKIKYDRIWDCGNLVFIKNIKYI